MRCGGREERQSPKQLNCATNPPRCPPGGQRNESHRGDAKLLPSRPCVQRELIRLVFKRCGFGAASPLLQ